MDTSQSNTLDTLRLSEQAIQSLMARLEADEKRSSAGELRGEDRISYDVPAGTVLKLRQPGGSECTFLVRPRNLSRNGIGFLHGSFIYLGSPCEMWLMTSKKERVLVRGKVAWCRHVTGRVHEIGVVFDSPIAVGAFLQSCVPSASGQAECSQSLPQLSGKALYVEDNEDDRELLKFHLNRIGLDLQITADPMSAMELVEKTRFDLILTSYTLPGMTGPELAQLLRSSGVEAPILALAADVTDELAQEAKAQGCTELMSKSYTFEQIVETLVRHLKPAAPQQEEGVYSTHWSNLNMRPLILKYLHRLEGHVKQLAQLLEDDANASIAMKLCLDVKGSCGGYGYPAIHQSADTLYKMLETGKLTADVREKFREFQSLCDSACSLRHKSTDAEPSPTNP